MWLAYHIKLCPQHSVVLCVHVHVSATTIISQQLMLSPQKWCNHITRNFPAIISYLTVEEVPSRLTIHYYACAYYHNGCIAVQQTGFCHTSRDVSITCTCGMSKAYSALELMNRMHNVM